MQRFEMIEGSSSKFWEVDVVGSDLTVCFGRTGTAGQSKTKTFPDAAAAAKERDKLVKEKTGKGYRLAGAAGVAATDGASDASHGTPSNVSPDVSPAALSVAPLVASSVASATASPAKAPVSVPGAVSEAEVASMPVSTPVAQPSVTPVKVVAVGVVRDLRDGETFDMQGSGSKPYVLKNTGGVYSCSCPAWRNQSIAIETRTCKHLRKLRGDAAEQLRIGADSQLPGAPVKRSRGTGGEDGASAVSAPPVLLAHSFTDMNPAVDPTGWWISEKLDGVRAWWDGKGFVSRLGNPYLAPDWFTQTLPDFPLDGELWLGRKQFQRCVSIVRRQDRNEAWQDIRFVIFDAPTFAAPFEQRLAHCAEWFARGTQQYAVLHAHEVCRGQNHLDEELQRVEALGGEGLMLRQPASDYVAGRSTTLLKVKSFLDTEARVIGHTKGAGRHKGRLGALEVELANGKRFSVGTGLSDAEREAPPELGSIVGVRYQELSDDGVPRFPTYLGVRDDIAWQSDSDR